MAEATPFELWTQADQEHPGNASARGSRYRELMRKHGHLVDAKPGEPRNLPCGWPGLPADDLETP